MFSQFENMFDKIKTTVAKKINNNQPEDYAHTPQKYNISGREIQQIKLLSQGAFGFIWLAEDIKTKQQFALKRVICMTQDRLSQAKKQKDIMSILPRSPNIVQYVGGDIISRGTSQKVVITVMQLCDGGTLFDLLQKRENKGFTQTELVNITIEILLGLQAIHNTGYYHRDVKIQNVLLGKDKRYKLCDFGSCTKQIYDFSIINKKDFDSTKQEIQGLTTPMYRPPEIVDPYLKYLVNNKADIWMTGCVLYTLAYFIHPFVDSNAIGIAAGTYRFLKYPEETKYRVSQKINDLIRHMLTPNPSFRPSTKQLIELLRNWDNITEVPLNSQAIRRKKQQKLRNEELAQLNKKCVEFDGDIPIEKLMQLQKKLKKPVQEDKSSSFINTKTTQKIKDQNAYGAKVQANNLHKDPFMNGASLMASNGGQNQQGFQAQNTSSNSNSFNSFNTSNPFGQMAGKSNPPKKDANINSLWGANFGTTPSNNQSSTANKGGNFFDNAFGSKPINQTQTSQNSINFQQMFADTPTVPKTQMITDLNKPNTNTSKSSNQINLLGFNNQPQKKTSQNLLDF